MKITKKNGSTTLYDDQKVVNSIMRANAETTEELSEEGAFDITYDVFSRLTDENEIITTQEVRDCINEVLCERGLLETARRYADYKEECHSDQV